MKALTRTVSREVSYKDDIREIAQPATGWIVSSDQKIDSDVRLKIISDRDLIDALFMLSGICIACGVSFNLMAEPASFANWVAPLLFASCYASREIAIHTWWFRRCRRRLESERESSLLYRRAVLIRDAVENYCEHCDRYEAGRELAAQGVGLIDASTWDEYHAMLERAKAVIVRSVENFEAARIHERKITAFVSLHAPVQSSALSELVALLDRPMEVPELPGVSDLSDEFEIGEEMSRLTEEIQEDYGFDERLRRASAAKTRVASPEADVRPDAESAEVVVASRAATV